MQGSSLWERSLVRVIVRRALRLLDPIWGTSEERKAEEADSWHGNYAKIQGNTGDAGEGFRGQFPPSMTDGKQVCTVDENTESVEIPTEPDRTGETPHEPGRMSIGST